MNLAFLPDLSALAILILILALVRRRHSDARADAWLLGLSFTLVESLAHTFYAPQGIPSPALHLIVLDCYLIAGLVFNWAAGDQRVADGSRLLYLTLNGLALMALTTIYGLNLRIAKIYLPPIIVGMVVGVVSSLVLRKNWRYALFYLVGWGAIGFLVLQGQFRPAVYWSLACMYAIAAVNFYRRLEGRSAGRLAVVLGFSIWALCFFLHPWIVEQSGYAEIASHVWNMQKSLISIGMILVMLEEQVSNNEWLALHDELTGLPNRRLFAARLTNAIQYTDSRRSSLALVVLDLNDFKKINDTLGHPVGDQVLREVAMALRKNIRATDTVARLGGDEFIIAATDMPNEETVERFTDALRQAIERPMLVNDRPMVVGASFGFAMYPRDAKDATKLLRLADQRMYGIKRRPVYPAQIDAASKIVAQA
ncbi:MAG TPA: GGDEF domain-containing protein [Acidobacteriaceae bacterium]|nr:GGDEF domain-containing protein [Acidobacteriaceae bacterium]